MRARRAILPLLLLAGCGGHTSSATPGQLVVVFETDLTVPKDLDGIGFEVVQDGDSIFSKTFAIGENGVKVPATLTLVSGATSRPVVLLRTVGYRGGEPRIVREILVTVPSDRTAMLELPLQWLSVGSARKDPAADPKSNALGVVGACGEGLTDVAGSCVDPHVDASRLRDYSIDALYGVPKIEEAKGFDVLGCFGSARLVQVDTTDCTLPADVPIDGSISLAIHLPPGSDGFCNGAGCFVPLDPDDDANPGTGWFVTTTNRVALPAGACTVYGAGRPFDVAVSAACAPKSSANPPCGPWSAVAGCAGVGTSP